MIQINFQQPEGLTKKGIKKWADAVGSYYEMNHYFRKEFPILQREDFKEWQFYDKFKRDKYFWEKISGLLHDVPRHDLEEVFEHDNSVSVILSNLIQEVIYLREEVSNHESQINRLEYKVDDDD